MLNDYLLDKSRFASFTLKAMLYMRWSAINITNLRNVQK